MAEVTPKIAAVTGSRRGIGRAIAKALAKDGYTIILSGASSAANSADFLREFRREIGSAEYISCDISKTQERDAYFEFIEKKFGRLDVLVNNAGVAPRERLDLLETTEDSFDYVMDVNLRGTFFMCQAAANLMIKTQKSIADYRPRIVNISSISAYTASVNRGEYCVSKAGLSMATALFADRLAEYGIPVFEVRPGIIMTDMTSAVTEKYQTLIDGGLTPIKRFGQPEDVADCVLAAVRGHLDFATGQVLNPDGGFHLRRL